MIPPWIVLRIACSQPIEYNISYQLVLTLHMSISVIIIG